MTSAPTASCPRCGAPCDVIGPGGGRCECGHDFTRSELEAARAAPVSNGRANVAGAQDLPVQRWSGMIIAEVEPETVRWLWRGRIPLGKVTVLDGDPGLGKSVLTLDLAARVSTGSPMPDGSSADIDGPAGVVILSAEDGLSDTIRPRLDAAGADLARALAVTQVVDLQVRGDYDPNDGQGAIRILRRLPTLEDLEAIEEAIAQVGARLLIIDPLMAYLPTERNAYRDQDVRHALAPLAELAERTGVSIVVVRHLNKAGGGNPLYRGGGSIGIIGAARAGLMVAKDPDDPSGRRRVLAPTKCNLTAEPPSLAYHLEAAGDTVMVVWDGVTQLTAEALLAVPLDKSEKSALEEAADFLRDVLGDGPRPAKVVGLEARAVGISDITLRRARQQLSVSIARDGFGAGSVVTWKLPYLIKDPIDAHTENVSKYEGDDQVWADSPLAGPPSDPCPVCQEVAWLPSSGRSGYVCGRCYPSEGDDDAIPF